jgi:hypothetical protein
MRLARRHWASRVPEPGRWVLTRHARLALRLRRAFLIVNIEFLSSSRLSCRASPSCFAELLRRVASPRSTDHHNPGSEQSRPVPAEVDA